MHCINLNFNRVSFYLFIYSEAVRIESTRSGDIGILWTREGNSIFDDWYLGGWNGGSKA